MNSKENNQNIFSLLYEKRPFENTGNTKKKQKSPHHVFSIFCFQEQKIATKQALNF